MSVKLEHANIDVHSIAKSQAFLAAAFDDFHERGSGHSSYGYWSHFGNDDTYIALQQKAKPGEESDQVFPHKQGNLGSLLNHVGFVVEDLDPLIAKLKAKGFEPSQLSLNDHPHRRRVYYYDDNGLEWEFVQYLSDKPEERNDYSV